MMKTLQKQWVPVAIGILLFLLVSKYCWSLFLFPDVPFGYDAGIYRYLFLKHAQAFPPFSVAVMPPWAASHPLGLFFFSSILLKLGIPVDWLIGWMWNIFSVFPILLLARVFARRSGAMIGLLVLLVGLLSTVQYQGFLMIYWKVFVALFWCVLAFDAFERQSKRWLFFGMMTIALHQQIGLIFVLATLCSILSLSQNRKVLLKHGGGLLMATLLGLLWYIPNGGHALLDVLPMLIASLLSPLTFGVLFVVATVAGLLLFLPLSRPLILLLLFSLLWFALFLVPLMGLAPAFLGRFLQSGATVPGAFFTVPEYLELSLPLLLLGVIGLSSSFRRETGSVWQWAALWCALAVLSMFFFYQRFLLPLDFFLLPFAALALENLLTSKRREVVGLAVAAILVQGWLLLSQMAAINPHVDRAMLDQFSSLQRVIEPKAQVIVLDIMAPWVAGFLPDNAVSGPGIFDSQPLAAWQGLLYGSDAERRAFIEQYSVGTYFFATDVFRSYYPPEVQTLFLHSCLQPMPVIGLLRSVCGSSAAGGS